MSDSPFKSTVSSSAHSTSDLLALHQTHLLIILHYSLPDNTTHPHRRRICLSACPFLSPSRGVHLPADAVAIAVLGRHVRSRTSHHRPLLSSLLKTDVSTVPP